jgi:GT2 family glycosyltransferase
MHSDATLLDWSLCIATLNRRAALVRTLVFAARQTRPPRQIVVVDVSDDWEDSRAEVERLLAPYPDIALDYVTSPIRSSATQRNAGIALCRHDIVFLLDDDSFLHPTAAEEVLRVYAADPAGEVAAVAAVLVPDLPPLPEDVAGQGALVRKTSGRRAGAGLKTRILQTDAGRWFNRKVLLQNKDELFLKYDGPRQRPVPSALAGYDVTPVSFMPGSAMTVRRDVALAEPFDTALRYYAAFEDLDVAYRYARHGAVLRANRAHLHHFEAAGGRLKRKKLVIFQLLNMLVFLKRHAADPDRFLPVYRRLLRRRLFGEALKDLLSGRITLPQARGVLVVMRTWREVWARDTATIDDWYPAVQQEILEGLD